jgi:large subunit ribosomal protein L24
MKFCKGNLRSKTVKLKIRRGDTVEVINGHREDKGKRGEVIKVLPKLSRITIQGVNIRKKHQRQFQTQGRTMQPGIIELEMPVHLSNVMLVCPSCNEPTRVGITRQDGEVQRFCKRCEATFD